jgi:hypothetical protein
LDERNFISITGPLLGKVESAAFPEFSKCSINFSHHYKDRIQTLSLLALRSQKWKEQKLSETIKGHYNPSGTMATDNMSGVPWDTTVYFSGLRFTSIFFLLSDIRRQSVLKLILQFDA